ncbi:MAG TPA: methyltransferase domain-containing protein [Chitinophagales bacterium]|nr:methyltransferase domain-containing protein [Chitinophagales bacterium]
MTFLDKYLQNARINQARKFVRKNDVVLDIGAADGVMFEKWRGWIQRGFGIDPRLKHEIKTALYTLIPGYFPQVTPKELTFDVITMLAVIEHIPAAQQAMLAENCYKLLNEKGRIIITVPSPPVDAILDVLLKLRLLHGMSIEEHYGYKPEQTTQIFPSKYFRLIHQSTFQFGLNNLFVFEKI